MEVQQLLEIGGGLYAILGGLRVIVGVIDALDLADGKRDYPVIVTVRNLLDQGADLLSLAKPRGQ